MARFIEAGDIIINVDHVMYVRSMPGGVEMEFRGGVNIRLNGAGVDRVMPAFRAMAEPAPEPTPHAVHVRESEK